MIDEASYLQLFLVPTQNTQYLIAGPQKMQITQKLLMFMRLHNSFLRPVSSFYGAGVYQTLFIDSVR